MCAFPVQLWMRRRFINRIAKWLAESCEQRRQHMQTCFLERAILRTLTCSRHLCSPAAAEAGGRSDCNLACQVL